MKGWFSFAGWVLFLLAVAAGLVLYNARHLPVARELARQRGEISMWTSEVQGLQDSIVKLQRPEETEFLSILTDDELFNRPGMVELSETGEAALQELITDLQQTLGTIQVTGHTAGGDVPDDLKERCADNWEVGALKAAAVVRSLADWGIPARRLLARSAGDSRPRGDNNTAEGRARNRRVEILVAR